MAIMQFGPDWKFMAAIVAIFFVGQLVADYVLTPRLIGRRVHLNPVWLMFAIFALGYLLGFVGVLIAVPLAAAIGVVTRFATPAAARGLNHLVYWTKVQWARVQ